MYMNIIYPQEICAVSKISKKEIGRCFKLILKALETSVELITTGDFMSRFCSNLGKCDFYLFFLDKPYYVVQFQKSVSLPGLPNFNPPKQTLVSHGICNQIILFR